jgi:drug/metabolite transporter (DMT)-like permease
MVLVILAALCVAAFAILFRFFDRYQIPLFPAITINYLVACISGLFFAPPWEVGDLELLWTPAIALGALFVTIFSLTGISAQKAGAARTTIAGRMSLVITVAGNMLLFRETIGPYAWAGMACALAGLLLVSAVRGEHTSDRSWLLPFIIFLGSGIADVGVSIAQRVRTTAVNGAAIGRNGSVRGSGSEAVCWAW